MLSFYRVSSEWLYENFAYPTCKKLHKSSVVNDIYQHAVDPANHTSIISQPMPITFWGGRLLTNMWVMLYMLLNVSYISAVQFVFILKRHPETQSNPQIISDWMVNSDVCCVCSNYLCASIANIHQRTYNL